MDIDIQDEPNLDIFPQNLKSAADFCPECGNILELPLYDDYIECNFCNYRCHILAYKSETIVSKLEFKDKKKWLEQYKKKKNFDGGDQKKKEELKPKVKKSKAVIISQECPMCHHPEMYFFTIQMRSADEGSTVFYECVKCDYKSTVNN